jgi:hypothetical protein
MYKLSCRTKAPLARSKDFFRDAGLCAEGRSPTEIRLANLVTDKECVAAFGVAKARKKYRYDKCSDPRVRQKVEELFPFIYNRCMDKSKLCCLEFIMDVLADIRGIQVIWVSFAMDANKKQIRN